MRVQLGDHVRTRDGQDVGAIDRLIFDPESGEVRSVVVCKGFILPDDATNPLETMHPGPEGSVRLTYTAGEVERLPRFVEAEYTAPPVGWVPPFGYPPTGLLWPVQPPLPGPASTAPEMEGLPREVVELLERRARATAVIAEGSEVVSRDGEKVGAIHRVTVDTESGEVTGLVVRRGFLLSEDLELPPSVVASVGDGAVYLLLDRAEIDRLAPGRR